MATKKQIQKFRKGHPEHNNWSNETVDNWLEKRRDLDVCAYCPEHARGLCCIGAVKIHTPSKWVCEIHCTAHVRGICNIDREKLPEKSKIIYVVTQKQPCKFLDPKTKLCSVYKDRFWKRRTCLPIKDAINQGAVPLDCAYLEGRKKKSYAKKPHKILRKEIDLMGCKFLEMTWELYEGAQHEGRYGFNEY